MRVADGAGKRVGSIGRGRGREREQAPDHLLDLLLRGFAMAHHRLFDLQRGVFGYRQIGEDGRGDRGATRLTEK